MRKIYLQVRKIVFVQEFLNVQIENLLSRLEKLLRNENKIATNDVFESMSILKTDD